MADVGGLLGSDANGNAEGERTVWLTVSLKYSGLETHILECGPELALEELDRLLVNPACVEVIVAFKRPD